jgi:hypothetical protein
MTVESVVGYDIGVVDVRDGFELVYEMIQNGFTTDFKQGFGKIFGQGI